jgi:hypothetical protein
MLKSIRQLKKMKSCRAQSAAEYMVLFAGVVAFILIFMTDHFEPAYKTTLTSGTNSMMNMSTRLFGR